MKRNPKVGIVSLIFAIIANVIGIGATGCLAIVSSPSFAEAIIESTPPPQPTGDMWFDAAAENKDMKRTLRIFNIVDGLVFMEVAILLFTLVLGIVALVTGIIGAARVGAKIWTSITGIVLGGWAILATIICLIATAA